MKPFSQSKTLSFWNKYNTDLKKESKYSNIHLPEGAHTDPDSVSVVWKWSHVTTWNDCTTHGGKRPPLSQKRRWREQRRMKTSDAVRSRSRCPQRIQRKSPTWGWNTETTCTTDFKIRFLFESGHFGPLNLFNYVQNTSFVSVKLCKNFFYKEVLRLQTTKK